MKPPETPFPKHWLYYIVIKLLVLAVAVAIGTKYVGLW
jgi:hypothetical protein